MEPQIEPLDTADAAAPAFAQLLMRLRKDRGASKGPNAGGVDSER
jgi:hypothetical protein